MCNYALDFSVCCRNVSSERSEARRKLRDCNGLVDSIMYIVQSQINCKDVDNKVTAVCTQCRALNLDSFCRTCNYCLIFFAVPGLPFFL